VSIIIDVRCNWVKGYSQKYNIGYIAGTGKKHIMWLHKGFHIGVIFILNSFLIQWRLVVEEAKAHSEGGRERGRKEPCKLLNISQNSQLYTQPDFVCYIWVRYDKRLLCTVINRWQPCALVYSFSDQRMYFIYWYIPKSSKNKTTLQQQGCVPA
jgi:hypothetical protein